MSLPVSHLIRAVCGYATPAARVYGSLAAYWEFSETGAATTYTDAYSTNNLSIVQSSGTSLVAYTASAVTDSGLVGRAFRPQSSVVGAVLSPSLSNLFMLDTDWSLVFWFKTPSPATPYNIAIAGVIGKDYYNEVKPARAGVVFRKNPPGTWPYTLQFWLRSSDGSLDLLDAGILTSDTTAWFMVAAIYDKSNGRMRFRVKSTDGVLNADVNKSHTAGIDTSVANAQMSFNLPATNNVCDGAGTSVGQQFGYFDQACFLNKALLDDEFTYLFNSGAARTFAALKADAGF